MKILIAYTASGTSDNPFVRLLADGIRACGYEVVCSVEEFRSNAADYDIVHLQWPEELFRWKAPAPADVDTLEQQFQTLKNNGIPLIYTRHNTLPHHGNPLVAEAYGLVERYADAIVHLGDCSLREFTAAHPDSEQLQVMIPHHIYEGLYDMDITRDAGRRALGIPADRLVVLAFGAFRHAEERRLVWGAFRRLHYPAKFLLAPRLWPYTRRGSRFKGLKRLAGRLLYAAAHSAEGFFDSRITSPEPLIPDEQLPCYLAAADVVFIQRTDILNSGNVPLALSFGRVVTGPASGNIGGLLAETGNPAFDPADPRSVDIALERAARLSATDQGARNRAYAQEHFGIGRIAAMYGGLYERLYDGKRQ